MSGTVSPTIVACVKLSPDTAQLRVDPLTGAPELDGAPRRIGTFDENALEEAVRLKERLGGTVLAVSLAAAAPPELILKALAMGADQAFVIEDATAVDADALATTRVLAAAVEKLERWDLILCGEGSLDAYNRQVGPRLAEALEIPVITHVTRIEAREGALLVHRSLEDRTEIVGADPPLVLTVGQEINQPRFPTVLQIMAAASKPTTTWNLRELGFAEGETAGGMSGLRTLRTFAPRDERQRITIPGSGPAERAEDLARRLFELGLVKVE